jgi:hypothetical protein
MGLLILLGIVVFGIVLLLNKRQKPDSQGNETGGSSWNSSTEDALDYDSWEGGFWEAPDPKPLNAHLRFDYSDGDNKKTSRSVVMRQFDTALYDGIILGHCELRNANRTFRFNRISNCVDMETGEVISDIRTYLVGKYDKSPERSVEILRTDYVDTLKVLCYIAKADGQFRKEEKTVITGYLQTLIRDARINVDMVNEAMQTFGLPSVQSFKLAVGRVLQGGQVDPELLSDCCKAIVATQKAIHPSEQEALDYIAKKRNLLKLSTEKSIQTV